MGYQLLWGLALITTTVVIHAVMQERLMDFLEWLTPHAVKHMGSHWKMPITIVAVMGMLGALILEMWLWAFVLYATNEPALHSLESALYYSASTFTTLGFGDITLSPQWRLLGSFEATNGLLMFGWSTAFLFEIISDLYRDDRIGRT